MLKGNEIILAPNAYPMEINRISTFCASALENMTSVATATYPQGWPGCSGHSNVFDRMVKTGRTFFP